MVTFISLCQVAVCFGSRTELHRDPKRSQTIPKNVILTLSSVILRFASLLFASDQTRACCYGLNFYSFEYQHSLILFYIDIIRQFLRGECMFQTFAFFFLLDCLLYSLIFFMRLDATSLQITDIVYDLLRHNQCYPMINKVLKF